MWYILIRQFFMKNRNKWLGLLVAMSWSVVGSYAQAPETQTPSEQPPPQAAAGTPTELSPGATEVIRLAESGSGDAVVLAYIRNSQLPFNLTADHVLYLKD